MVKKLCFLHLQQTGKRINLTMFHGTWGPYFCRYRLCPASASVLLQAMEGAREAQFVAVVACLDVDSRESRDLFEQGAKLFRQDREVGTPEVQIQEHIKTEVGIEVFAWDHGGPVRPLKLWQLG